MIAWKRLTLDSYRGLRRRLLMESGHDSGCEGMTADARCKCRFWDQIAAIESAIEDLEFALGEPTTVTRAVVADPGPRRES